MNIKTMELFYKLFGLDPKVGDCVTILDAFNRTLKGVTQINDHINKWRKKGIVVEYFHDTAIPAMSRYILREFPGKK